MLQSREHEELWGPKTPARKVEQKLQVASVDGSWNKVVDSQGHETEHDDENKIAESIKEWEIELMELQGMSEELTLQKATARTVNDLLEQSVQQMLVCCRT